jgi:NRPS condensation-like uncharacterized protein
VTQITTTAKQNGAILPTALFFEFLGSLSFPDTKKLYENLSQQNQNVNTFPPFLSNIGVINPISFGEHTAQEGYIVTPAMFAPLFMLGASTYNNVLTLVVNYHTSDNKRVLIEKLLDLMLIDLKRVIK